MLPPELAAQIRMLEIRTDCLVDEICGGAYRSAFKGRGMEFDEVREYTVGDDVRDIDWNVTARMGNAYVKKYIEERELTVLLLVDVSASGAYGSGAKSKLRTAAELAALIAFSAGKNHDRVGLLMFSDKVELYVPPKSGRTHTLRLIREILAFEPHSRGTDVDMALRQSFMLMKKRGVIFLLSDLLADKPFESSLSILNRKHDVIALELIDRTERHWPLSLPVAVEDAESGEAVLFCGGKAASAELDRALAASQEERSAICRRSRVDLVEIESGTDVLRPVISFFDRRRARRFAGRGGER